MSVQNFTYEMLESPHYTFPSFVNPRLKIMWKDTQNQISVWVDITVIKMNVNLIMTFKWGLSSKTDALKNAFTT